MLRRWNHPHVDILLVGSLDLLLLLLEELDLLLDCQLFHCRNVMISTVLLFGGAMTTTWPSKGEDLLPGDENMLINGVSSEGLLRWAMCNRRPVGPGTPPCGGCWFWLCSMMMEVHVECEILDRFWCNSNDGGDESNEGVRESTKVVVGEGVLLEVPRVCCG